ncbi:hypothetical protein BG004_008021 [Podila humilis]|nr:hypothetical protein BG004_008021 [Podila humilis]
MDQLAPALMKYLEEAARPHIQQEVTEQLNSTKSDLKSSLPQTVMNYLTGAGGNETAPEGGNAMLSQLVNSLGPNFTNALTSVTNTTVDTASEGMDKLLTDGVLNIAKGVLTKTAVEEGGAGNGGFNFDFLTQGKEGMVSTTMAASTPVVKQVSDNMGNKISTSFPTAIGSELQQMFDQNGGAGGAGGAMGMAAGFMSQFLGGGNNGGAANGAAKGVEGDATAGGGSIQQMIQNFLSPKILLLIQPYLQKFEAQMMSTLENELRTKVFSADYIKSTVMDMLTGGGGEGGQGGQGSAADLVGGLMNTFMKGNGQNDGGGNADTLGSLANFASSFLKK